ncbi:MAG TPA: hypothetical protein VL282_02175, partial [Tepidisphaeraceae bacterium]|nr:hypothetical protein [Tepidisphaeraceae bacterium]
MRFWGKPFFAVLIATIVCSFLTACASAGYLTVYDAQRAVDDAKAAVDAACAATATARSNRDSAQTNYDAAAANLKSAQSAIDEGQIQLAKIQPDVDHATADLLAVSKALAERGLLYDQAKSRADAAAASIDAIRKDAEAQFHASPAWHDRSAAIESAQDDLDEVNDLVLFDLSSDAQHQQLVATAQKLRDDVDRLRQQSPNDSVAIGEASKRWLDAQNAVQSFEDSRLDAIEYVRDARAALAQRRAEQAELVKKFETDFANDPRLADASKARAAEEQTLKSLDAEIAQLQKDRDGIDAQLKQMVAFVTSTKQTMGQAQSDLEGLRRAVDDAANALNSANTDLTNALTAESSAKDALAYAQYNLDVLNQPQVVEVVPAPTYYYYGASVGGRYYYHGHDRDHDGDRNHYGYWNRDRDRDHGRDDHGKYDRGGDNRARDDRAHDDRGRDDHGRDIGQPQEPARGDLGAQEAAWKEMRDIQNAKDEIER